MDKEEGSLVCGSLLYWFHSMNGGVESVRKRPEGGRKLPLDHAAFWGRLPDSQELANGPPRHDL